MEHSMYTCSSESLESVSFTLNEGFQRFECFILSWTILWSRLMEIFLVQFFVAWHVLCTAINFIVSHIYLRK